MAEDTEKVLIPLVSELLEQASVPRVPDNVFRYDRDEMMRLRTVPLSVTRPDILSTDFDGDDGKFSPFKWLEHRWEVEGIKNRPANKKLQDALRADCDENAGLSPQRRGFSSGCRAPPDEKKEKEVYPLSVKEEGWNTIDNTKALFAAAGSKWRTASTSSMEKFSSTKGNDFKLPFQKTAAAAVDKTGRPTTWKTVEGKERQNGSFSATGKFIPARSYRGCDERGEKLPEWADDPTTIDDMIELKGFEEPAKGKKKTKTAEMKPKTTRGGSQSGSRPSSRNHASESDVHGNGDEMPMALPDTDAELAAILGLSNFPSVSKASTAPQSSGQAGSGLVGSRMSKFFSRNPGGEDSAKENMHQHEPMSVAGEIASNPTLSKLFSHSSTGNVSPQSVQRNVQNLRPMRLEDLERTYMPQITDNGGGGDVSKFFHQQQPRMSSDGGKGGSVLQDPQAQAQLLQKLHRVARQQEEGAESPPLQRPAQSLPPGYPIPGVPQIPPDHIIAAQATHLLNMQLQQVYPGGVHQLPPQQLERMHKELMRNVLARHQQIQALMVNNMQAAQQAKMQAPRPAMIPASVQRHMNRSSVPQMEKMEKERDSDEEMRQAEALKKQQMQQQYNALMSAMQNGFSLAAVRPGGAVPPSAGAPPATPGLQAASSPQMNALLAQAQVQQMQRAAYLHRHQQLQQQQAMIKLMAYQQQQQQQQQNGLEGERRANGNSDPLVGSIQTPLEKLLTAAGVQPSQFTGSSDSPSRSNGAPGFPPSARPMSLEEIERNIPNGAPPGTRPMSLQELERQLTENQSNVA